MDNSSDKYSIKNILFTRAIPNLEIPVPYEGYKIYPCTDCGDKFVFESSYNDHVNRKSVLITYMCRYCSLTKVFYNRCMLLSHIRSHSFKTATINVNDLKVEPLPLSFYNIPVNTPGTSSMTNQATTSEVSKKSVTVCSECNKPLPCVGFAYKDRAAHYMQYTNEFYSCPVCLFTLPTLCGLRAHLRFHLKYAPYYCPECGVNIVNKNVHYPFNHDCEGFKMMRATARMKCPVPQCQLFHPNDFKDHMKESHIKKVYKCPICVVACFNEPTMQKHLKSHSLETVRVEHKALIFFQCEMCPGRLVLQNHIENHLHTHVNNSVFPCWTCGMVFKEVFALIDHNVKKHDHIPANAKSVFTTIIHESENQSGKAKRIYRVVKRCDQCKRNFTYKCKYSEISVLPNECPYKCSSKLRSSFESETQQNHLICHLCEFKMPNDWADIKKHYAEVHKNHRCLEPKLVLNKMDVQKYLKQNQSKISKRKSRKQKRRINQTKEMEQETPSTTATVSGYHCTLCTHSCENKETLETHLRSHLDPCMAYQCLECGISFVAKPCFSKHLMLVHGICDVEEYIENKQCYNKNALNKNLNSDLPMEPVKENQCTICRDQFENNEDLEKHFRVHGMAFLLKNTNNEGGQNSK